MRRALPITCALGLLGACQGITVVDPVVDTKSDVGDTVQDETEGMGSEGESEGGESSPPPDTETGSTPDPSGDADSSGDDPPPPLTGDPLAGFAERSAELGIDFAHSDAEDKWLTPGQAWGDFDRDGHLDLVLTSQAQANAGFRGSADGSFSAPPWSASVALPELLSAGVVAADYDNDGDLDLYMLADGPNTLLRNLGGLAFEDRTAAAGVDDSAESYTATFGDYDRDGWLDLYVANNKLDQPDRLFHNLGDGSFADASQLLDEATRTRLGLSASFFDYDDDGDVDLYVANDKLQGNVLWRNDGPGCGGWCFTDVSLASGAGVEMHAMGLAIGDYDNDGDRDVFITDIGEAVLLQNQRAQGEAHFVDVAAEAGVLVDDDGWGEYSWGTQFLDYDNDGWLDLYVNIGPMVPGPAQPNCLYRNRGDGSFDKLEDVGGAADDRRSFGLAVADFDADGWLDLLVGNRGDHYALYQNQGGGHHYLSVELAGDGALVNRDGVGAKLWLHDDSGRTQVRELIAGSSLGSGSSLALHFGLGEALPVSATLEWPDGSEQHFDAPPVDTTWQLSY